MAIREKVFKIITETFQKHGAVEINTPVMELKVNSDWNILLQFKVISWKSLCALNFIVLNVNFLQHIFIVKVI